MMSQRSIYSSGSGAEKTRLIGETFRFHRINGLSFGARPWKQIAGRIPTATFPGVNNRSIQDFMSKTLASKGVPWKDIANCAGLVQSPRKELKNRWASILDCTSSRLDIFPLVHALQASLAQLTSLNL
jgi:hypothetical protein